MPGFYRLDCPPYKLFISDLNKCTETATGAWDLQLQHSQVLRQRKYLNIRNVWIQGYIEDVSDYNAESLIVNDKTGKSKVTKCSSLPGDISWIANDVYCSVVGTFVRQGSIPEIAAIKITRLDENPVSASMWSEEVKEMKLLLTGKVWPNLSKCV